ncbi:MAG TPA: UDP-2,3-diacylglucosamine diphosphatase [Anaerohalosphaeraceae bacterium]|jgi:UDP-2,3-diacylglucosamine pyrophosphatase LpxH|nr:UDP-2,3-diacylglucosamine diphosphatase [Anaerohalosphaeraceae bacterium]
MVKQIENNRTLFVVSDLHMGDGGPRDNFAADNKAAQFSLFLDYVEQEDGELLILGDLFEFWQANIGRVLIKRMDFLDRFANMQAWFVVGNHDADFEALIGTRMLAHPFFDRMTGPFERIIGNKRYKFMHGHELDPFNQDGTPRWGRILVILGGLIEDRKGSPLLSAGGFSEKALLRMGRGFLWMWNNSVSWLDKNHRSQRGVWLSDCRNSARDPRREKGILALYRQDHLREGYDVLVTGHTHHAMACNGWYYNTGCWIGLRNNFLRIEPDGSACLWEWKNNQAVRYEKPARFRKASLL